MNIRICILIYGYMDLANQPPCGPGSCRRHLFRPKQSPFWNVQLPHGLGSCHRRLFLGRKGAFWNVQPSHVLGSCRRRFLLGHKKNTFCEFQPPRGPGSRRRHFFQPKNVPFIFSTTPWSRTLPQELLRQPNKNTPWSRILPRALLFGQKRRMHAQWMIWHLYIWQRCCLKMPHQIKDAKYRTQWQ